MIDYQSGEQPLIKHGACNLSSINISEYVKYPFTKEAYIDYETLCNDVFTIVRAMDDVLEENIPNHALEEQREMAKKYRNIGIGIMGFHDALIKMGVLYGGNKSIKIAGELMQNLFKFSIMASSFLAEKRGSFPGYSSKIWDSAIVKNNLTEQELQSLKTRNMLRNCSLLSIAPTGSLGTMLNISTGCEPLFSDSYYRKTESLGGKEEYHKVLVPVIAKAKELNWHPECLVTSHDIPWLRRIYIQGALQRGCDTAISSTVNLNEKTTVEEVSDLFMAAWENGLKGVTIFRDNCARAAILSTKNEEKKEEKEEKEKKVVFDSIKPVSRKQMGITQGCTFCKKCACGTLYITVNKDHMNNIVEVFTHTSKGGICQANLNAETRMASLALRSGVKVDEVVDQLKGISCPACTAVKAKGGKIDGISCADIIGKALEEFKANDSVVRKIESEHPLTPDDAMPKEEAKKYTKCPECGEMSLTNQQGCVQCLSCGYSKCGE